MGGGAAATAVDMVESRGEGSSAGGRGAVGGRVNRVGCDGGSFAWAGCTSRWIRKPCSSSRPTRARLRGRNAQIRDSAHAAAIGGRRGRRCSSHGGSCESSAAIDGMAVAGAEGRQEQQQRTRRRRVELSARLTLKKCALDARAPLAAGAGETATSTTAGAETYWIVPRQTIGWCYRTTRDSEGRSGRGRDRGAVLSRRVGLVVRDRRRAKLCF